MASRRGPDNSVRIAVNGTVRGQNAANVYHAQLTTSSSIAQADLDTWVTSYLAAFKTRFQTVLASDYSLVYGKAVCFTPGGGELVSTITPTTWAGTGGSATSNGALSSVVSWNSGVYWRGGKPRTYLPMPSVSVNSGLDTLVASYRTNLGTAATNFRSDVNALTAGVRVRLIP
jgi:hypothetical protein